MATGRTPKGIDEYIATLSRGTRADVTAVEVFDGTCHCGAIGFAYRPSAGPGSWQVHACQCRFCRSHGARTASDPNGRISLHIRDASQLQRYRFALRTADFLVCRTCGVYIAAVIASPRGRFATINVNALRGALTFAQAEATSYDGESAEERQQRRERRWTPVVDPREAAVEAKRWRMSSRRM